MSRIIIDNRSKYLDKIFTTYNNKNLRKFFNGYKRPYYYIPPELVLNKYETDCIGVYNDLEIDINDPDGWNWVSNWRFKDILNKTCNLTVQEYFDICYLHINDTKNRPKCANCNRLLSFDDTLTLNYGYSLEYMFSGNPPCCSRECAGNYTITHPELHKDSGIFILNDWRVKVKSQMNHFISIGNINDECTLYIATTDSNIKFGITNWDINDRSEISSFKLKYNTIHSLWTNLTRVQAAYIEASIKLNFDGNEYISNNELHKLLSIVRNLKSKDIVNPTI